MPGPGRPAGKRVLTDHQPSEDQPTPKRHAPTWTPTRSKENRRPSSHLTNASPSVGRRPSGKLVSSSPFRHQFKTPTRPLRGETAQSTPECFSKVEIGTPFKAGRESSSAANFKSDDSDVSTDGDGFSVTVGVRVRPLNDREKADSDTKCVVTMNGNEVTVSSRYGQPAFFCYDHCFWSANKTSASFASQEAVYKAIGRPLLTNAFEGYNTCLFAYGQTGSGKSYTIMGSPEERGVIPRFCKDLFRRVEDPQEAHVSFKVEVSFFEIYNEKIHDLLAQTTEKTEKWDRSTPKKITLRVREHPTQGPYVEGLSTFQASSFADVHSWIETGNKQRATAATGMNDKSSRSHSVFIIMMTKTKKEFIEGEEHSHIVTSKINIIDLAGSERCSATNTTGDRLKEGANINRSLMTLGKVISGLSEKSLNPKKKVFIPYRDSVLTWLLRESLGGNSKTAMIATISPASTHSEETLSTLRYAKQARSIINVAKVNEDSNARLIRELRAEIESLKSMGMSTRGGRHQQAERARSEDMERLKEKLADSQQRMVEMEEAWQEKMKEAERRRRTLESLEKEKFAQSFKVDNTLPNLVNLNEDPQLSEVLLYILKDGETHIGRGKESAATTHDIQLNSALIADNHCLISNNGSYVTVRPVQEAETYVNGDRIHRSRRLHHGDRVVVGNYYFRFNHPREVQSSGPRTRHKAKYNFEYARNELASSQGARLEAEVEEARLQTQKEMLKGIEEAKKAAQQELDTQRRNFERKIKELENELKNQSMLGHRKEDSYKQKADSKVEQLQQENRMLKQELESSRRRMELEAQAARRALETGSTHQMRILRELEKEKGRLMRSVEKLQAAQRERRQRREKGLARVDSALKHRRDLLQLSMWLQEANNISAKLGRNMIFSRHDEETSAVNASVSKVTVRVNDTRQGLMTFWSLDVFEEKLLQMREAFQGNCSSREIDRIFSAEAGQWEKDFKLHSPIAHRHTSSTSSSRASTSASSCSSSQGRLPSALGDALDCITTSCLRHLETSVMRRGAKVGGDEPTLADRTIHSMHRLLVATTTIRECAEPGGSIDVEAFVLQAATSADLLTSLTGVWSSLVRRMDADRQEERPCSPNSDQSLAQPLESCGQELTTQVYELLQQSMRSNHGDGRQAAGQVEKSLAFLSRLLGELCFLTDTPCWAIGDGDENEKADQVDTRLKQGFLEGADVFVDKTIQESLTAIGQLEIQLRSALQDHNLKGEVKRPIELVLSLSTSAKILLHKCQEAQLELAGTQGGTQGDRPGRYFGQSYARSLGLSGEVQELRGQLKELHHCLVSGWKGSDFDPLSLRLPTEALLAVANRLPRAASTLELLGSHGNGSTLSDLSTASSADGSCRPTDLVRLASRQLVTHLRALQDYVRVTVRRSRVATDDSSTLPRRGKHVRFAEHLNKKAFIYKYSSTSSDTDSSSVSN
ncbi:kinesin-like protein KIF14 [Diadema antillarum]|uniref:kinesin-like protein KIF14 n=1 Tax=Diadema antillarum TaxID=105358 RepID=UPI003A8602C5